MRSEGHNPNPLAGYKAPRPGRPNPHPLPEGIPGVLRMIGAATTAEDRALVALCGLVGCRVQEAVSAKAGDVNRSERELRIFGKGDVVRHVPISEAAWRAMGEAYGTAAAVGTEARLVNHANSTARRRLTDLGARAGLRRPVASHDLRATFATAAYERSGRDICAVQELLGHASVETTRAYIGVTKDSLRKAVG